MFYHLPMNKKKLSGLLTINTCVIRNLKMFDTNPVPCTMTKMKGMILCLVVLLWLFPTNSSGKSFTRTSEFQSALRLKTQKGSEWQTNLEADKEKLSFHHGSFHIISDHCRSFRHRIDQLSRICNHYHSFFMIVGQG